MAEERPRGETTLVLLVGAPRSGTTWLQSMLGSHPAIASPQETDLFSRYLAFIQESWQRQLRGTPEEWEARRFKGLPAVLTEDEVRAYGRGLVDLVVDRALALKPGAGIVLEKSPSHAMCPEVVAEYAPEARVIHLVRDGRDVATSLLAASEGWGSVWAPRSLKRAARQWVRHVESARRYAEHSLPYLEVRYETLRQGDAAALAELHAFCGLDLTVAACHDLLERFSLSRMASGEADGILVGGEFAPYVHERKEPEGFFRKGAVGSWRTEWSAGERLLFDAVAGDLLVALGYEADRSWAASARERATWTRRTTLRRRAGALARRIGQRGDRLMRDLP